jgi:hypothetical protein
MSVDKYVKFISEQQKSMVNAGLANPVDVARISEQFNLNEVAAIMKHFRGEGQTHGDGSAQSAMNNHEKIMDHLHKTLGPKHPVYKKIASSLNKAQKQHAIADDHPYTDKFFRHKENASGHEDAAKEAYADHLKSSKKVDEAVIDALTSEDYVDMLHMYIEALESHFEDEDLQQIQELSQDTMKSYVKKSKADLNKNWKKAGYHYDKADDAEDSSKEAKHYDSGDKAMKNVAKREVGQYAASKKLGTNFKRKTQSIGRSDHLERRGYRD